MSSHLYQLHLKREQIKLVQIYLALRDPNDHRGRFLKRTFFYELDKHLSLGFRLRLEQVSDEDSFSHHKTYQLNFSPLDGHSPRPFPFDSTQHLLELILVGQLDVHHQEQQSSYYFQLIANDEDREIEDRCHIEIAIRSGPNSGLQQIPPFQHSHYHFHVDHLRSNATDKVQLKTSKTTNSQIFLRILSTKSKHNDQQVDLFRLNETIG